jgi:hypothetical protein
MPHRATAKGASGFMSSRAKIRVGHNFDSVFLQRESRPLSSNQKPSVTTVSPSFCVAAAISSAEALGLSSA